MRPFIRAALFFTTFVLTFTAVVQVAGRVSLAFLETAEARINAALADYRVELVGLRGDWRFLNPVVHVDEVRLPAGTLEGLTVELDLLESALRGEWLLARGHLSEGMLTVTRTEAGWHLLGMPPGEEAFDPRELLWHSDQLFAELTVRVVNGAEEAAFDVVGGLVNRGGWHLADVGVLRAGADDAHFRVRYDIRETIPFVRDEQRRLLASADSFVVPLNVATGVADLRLTVDELQLAWRTDAGLGGGSASVRTRLSSPEIEPLDTHIDVGLQADGSHILAAADTFSLSAGASRFEMSGASARADETGIELVLPTLDLAQGTGVARVVSRGEGRAGTWIDALNVRGTLLDTRAYVNLSTPGVLYRTRAREVLLDSHKGVPDIRNGSAVLYGSNNLVRAEVDVTDMFIALPEVFTRGWDLAYAYGALDGWFEPGYVAIRGHDIQLRTGGTTASGSFAVAQPRAHYDKRVSLFLQANNADFATAKSFIPYKLDPNLLRWLNEGPLAGQIRAADFVYHGQVHTEEGVPSRRVGLHAVTEEAAVRFEPNWPVVSGVAGLLDVSGRNTMFQVASAVSEGVNIGGSEVTVFDNGDRVEVNLRAQGDGAQYLDYIAASPLADAMKFITPEWQAGGALSVSGNVLIPLKDTANRQNRVNLRAALDGLSLHVPAFRSRFTELQGDMQFSLPHGLQGRDVRGQLWGHPVELQASFDEENVHFDVKGQLSAARTIQMMGMNDPRLFDGEYDYEARLSVGVNEDNPSTLEVTSDLFGVTVNAPDGLGKLAAEVAPTNVRLQFLPEYVVTAFRHRQLEGWLHIDEVPLRGAIGVAQEAPMIETSERDVVIVGALPVVRLEQWIGDGYGGVQFPFPWRIDALSIGELFVDDLAFPDVALRGAKGDTGMTFTLVGPDIEGRVGVPDEAPIDLQLTKLQLPATESSFDDNGLELPTPDPVAPELVADLPEANVAIDQLLLGDEDFGRWRFDIQRVDAETLRFADLTADVKGVNLASPEGVVWRGREADSKFVGTLTLNNLAETLPKWGYAATLESDQATIEADVRWPGSPLNVAVTELIGDVRFAAANGRFSDVESGAGALRIMSLLNLGALVRRLNLNFSDVTGKGVSFEEVNAHVSLGDGKLVFIEPMRVASTSSDFRIGGEVDLRNGTLDNEMVVTLPVTKGLPWYGVYIGLANPLAGLGVLVGERMLRKPLQQFSSAKYAVRGTLEEPDVRFVELFNTDISSSVSDTAVSETVPAEPALRAEGS